MYVCLPTIDYTISKSFSANHSYHLVSRFCFDNYTKSKSIFSTDHSYHVANRFVFFLFG